MSSNFTVDRVCENCGNKFSAKTTVTRYCSHKCNRTFLKRKARKQKIRVSDRQTASLLPSDFDLVRAKEFLSVKDLALLLNCSRQTVYNLISSKKIRAVNISSKKTLLPRSEIDKLFLPAVGLPKVPDIQTVMKIEACYSIGEIKKKYNISNKALYEIIKRHKIPKLKHGKFTYVPKSMIDSLLKLQFHSSYGDL